MAPGSELEHVGSRLKAEGSRVLRVKYDWLLALPKLHLRLDGHAHRAIGAPDSRRMVSMG